VVTTYPRSDVAHLAFVAALPYALTAIGVSRIFPARLAPAMGIGAVVLAGLFSLNFFQGWFKAEVVASALGPLRVQPKDAPAMTQLVSQVRPGDSLFVFPYMPVLYVVTQAKNPTRFSYLAPGMMTQAEELEMLQQLKQHPPEWLLYLQLTPEEFLRVFPHGSGLAWKFSRLEEWLEKHYRPQADPPVSFSGYKLWRRTPEF
jgi:hypothetical protein